MKFKIFLLNKILMKSIRIHLMGFNAYLPFTYLLAFNLCFQKLLLYHNHLSGLHVMQRYYFKLVINLYCFCWRLNYTK